jgi:hypothetical protein
MDIKKYDQFFEKELSLPELKNGKRGDLFLKKIINSEPLKLEKPKNGKDEIVISNREDIIHLLSLDGETYNSDFASQNLKPKSRYVGVFLDDDGNTYTLKDFAKTKEFGSSKGSSSGTAQTTISENLQCIMLSYIQHYDTYLDLETVEDIENILEDKKSLKSAKLSIPIKKEYLKYINKNWIYTFNTISNYLKNFLFENFEYDFYHDKNQNSFIKQLYSKYREVVKRDFNQSIHSDKWNPSDMWLLAKDKEKFVLNLLSDINSMTELNKLIDELFNSRILIGISLKMLKLNQTPNFIVNKEIEKPTYELDKVYLSGNPLVKTFDFSAYEVSSAGVRSIRITSSNNSSGIANINLEVKGDNARYGKINLNQINTFLTTNGLDPVLTKTELVKMSDDDLKDEIVALDTILKSLDKVLSTNSRDSKSDLNTASFICKYQGLLLMEVLLTSDIESVNRVLNSIMYYAMSIENDFFTSPKYIRIVD